jgi:hypothetical protein
MLRRKQIFLVIIFPFGSFMNLKAALDTVFGCAIATGKKRTSQETVAAPRSRSTTGGDDQAGLFGNGTDNVPTKRSKNEHTEETKTAIEEDTTKDSTMGTINPDEELTLNKTNSTGSTITTNEAESKASIFFKISNPSQ